MGVLSDEVLEGYLIVVEVETTVHEKSLNYGENKVRKEKKKYWKHYDNPDNIISFVSNLNENEKVLNIFRFNEFGDMVQQTVEFKDGRLQLVEVNTDN